MLPHVVPAASVRAGLALVAALHLAALVGGTGNNVLHVAVSSEGLDPGVTGWALVDKTAAEAALGEAGNCSDILGPALPQLASSGAPFVLGQRCTLVEVGCFPYCAIAYWAKSVSRR